MRIILGGAITLSILIVSDAAPAQYRSYQQPQQFYRPAPQQYYRPMPQQYYQPRVYTPPPAPYPRSTYINRGEIVGSVVGGVAAGTYLGPESMEPGMAIGGTVGSAAGQAYYNQQYGSRYYSPPYMGTQTTTPYMLQPPQE